MSFSSEQKLIVINDTYKNSCCRRALLSGILSSKAMVLKDCIELSVEKKEYCDFASRLIFEFYGKETQDASSKSGGRLKKIRFDSKAAYKYLRNVEDGEELFLEKCPGCAAAYFKGVFLACGTISDPQKQYLLEFSPAVNTEKISEKLKSLSFSPKVISRNSKKVISFKKATEIEDLCGFIGLTDAMFEITNTQIEREFLNNANRAVNCETNNIGKSVSASGKQIEAIGALIEHNLISSLPDELEYTARLRIQNDGLSLTQLSKLFTPPISKSGLSHRLTKIIEISEQLIKDKKRI